MRLVAKHIFLPSLAPLAIVGLYFTPLSLISCANRGLAALAVVLASLIAGIAVGLVAIRSKGRNEPSAGWWGLSALILAMPALLVLGPLG